MKNSIQEARPAAVGTPVRASINERKFFDSMKHLFASSYSVLGELMQNARRAGATRIDFTVDVEKKTASVVDDGHGIADFGVLVSLCDSGWSEQVQLTDKPFGMGLFSLFFAAQSVMFRSGGQSLTVSLDDIVNKRELLVQNDPETAGIPGTRIELIGLSDKMTAMSWSYGFGTDGTRTPTMSQEIQARAKGFPIPVFINGQECPRPYAKGALHGMQTPIGFVSYPGVTDDSPDIPSAIQSQQWFLQGLPIGRSSGTHRSTIVHLDSVQFTARMPDRSELFDQSEQAEKILAVLKGMVRNRLAQLKASLDPKDFALRHWENCKEHHCLHLMDDVPWIPANRFRRVDQVAMESDNVYGRPRLSEELISREQVLSGEVFAVRGGPCSTDDSLFAALRLKVMQRMGMLDLMDNLGEGHWFNAAAPSLDDLKFVWEVSGEKDGVSSYYGELGQCDVRLAEAVTIKITSEVDDSFCKEVVFQNDWLLLPLDPAQEDDFGSDWHLNCFVIGNGSLPDQPVDALSTFRDENEAYRDEWRETAAADFWGNVRSMRGDPLSGLVHSVLHKHMTELSEKQMPHMCVVRATQYRHHDGKLMCPSPDVIDITHEDFWKKVAGAMLTAGTEEEITAQAAVIRQAFTAVVQPGWQEPPRSSGQ